MRTLTSVAIVAVMAACSNPTSPLTIDVQRARWKALAIVNYDFTYETSGGFTNAPPGPWRIQVRQDTVRSVMRLADSSQLDTMFWPTVDRLFDIARDGANEGRLVTTTFDPALHYPTLIEYVPEPDRGGPLVASDLQKVP